MTSALPPYSNPPALAGADACLWDINAKRRICPSTSTSGQLVTRYERMRAPWLTPSSTVISKRYAPR
jgi:hypothetical protein